MGYSGEEEKQDSLAVELLNEASADLIFFKLKGEFPPRRIAVSLGGTVNQGLKVRLAGTLADEFDGDITFLNILSSNYTARQRAYSDGMVTDAVRQHSSRAIYRTELLVSDDIVETLVAESKKFDLLVLGTRKAGIFEKATVGSVAAQVMEKAECSVAVVRVISPVIRTWKQLRA
jgi:nucleotide-binding universal stress UspA family protein